MNLEAIRLHNKTKCLVQEKAGLIISWFLILTSWYRTHQKLLAVITGCLVISLVSILRNCSNKICFIKISNRFCKLIISLDLKVGNSNNKLVMLLPMQMMINSTRFKSLKIKPKCCKLRLKSFKEKKTIRLAAPNKIL